MSMYALASDRDAFRGRTRKTLVASTCLHAAFFLALALQPNAARTDDILTEVVWIASEPVVPAAAAMPAPAEEAPPVPVVTPEPDPEPQYFVRDTPVAEVEPVPQVAARSADALVARVSAITDARPSAPGLAAAAPAPSATRPSLAVAASAAPRSRSTVALARAETPASVPIAMARGEPVASPRPHRLARTAPAPARSRTAAMHAPVDSSLARELAGARLLGPVADRPLRSHRVPVYPEWAKREGVEASVSLRFLVQPDGRVRANILVERTSGFSDLDDSAVTALLAWRFEPLTGSVTGDQWGVITFKFRLSDQ